MTGATERILFIVIRMHTIVLGGARNRSITMLSVEIMLTEKPEVLGSREGRESLVMF